ncbi:hypothetical protein ACFXOD_36025 [Streptomyces sp. NPDC059161]|uniref:hypothetical protein n=1 Tax=Streptomyces sp. NPDC059161 TaxID=3346749 RepID=UPI00369EF458
MNRDEGRRPLGGAVRAGRATGSSRVIPRPLVPPGPLRDLKELLYQAYLDAGAPTLDFMADLLSGADADDDLVKGAPSRDTVGRLIGSAELPARQADVVSLVAVLVRSCGGEAEPAGREAAQLWSRARLRRPVGRPVTELDPFALAVHRAITVEVEVRASLPALPAYVVRDHDVRLREVLRDVGAGASRLVMLVGTSSTGKTRACWEAVQGLPDGWMVWQPPEHGARLLEELGQVGPRSVVWLNDAHRWLLREQGEDIAEALLGALQDPSRAPLLVLGTRYRLAARGNRTAGLRRANGHGHPPCPVIHPVVFRSIRLRRAAGRACGG